MRKVIYIAGYGRSGSTIMDIILSNHEEVIGLGEVSLLAEDYMRAGRTCSCNEPYFACPFWKDVANLVNLANLSRTIKQVESVQFLPLLLLNVLDKKTRQEYVNYHKQLFKHVRERSGKPIVVDSSKSARQIVGRFYALRQLVQEDVYVVHLVRDGLDTMTSLLVTGSNWELENHHLGNRGRLDAMRVVTGWVTANVLTTLLGHMLGQNRYIRVRYEEFVKDPYYVITKIGHFVGFDCANLTHMLDEQAYFSVGHQVGGNRVRHQGKIQLKNNVSNRHRNVLKYYQRAIFFLLGGWLQIKYGYPLT